MTMFRAMAKTAAGFTAVAMAGLAVLMIAGSAFGLEKQKDPAKLPGADILPADRLADWSVAGVPGGIPTDRTKLIDVTKAPYSADNSGAADAQPAIMKAIANAQDNEVVYLPAGTYRVNSAVTVAGGKSKFFTGDPRLRKAPSLGRMGRALDRPGVRVSDVRGAG